MSKFVIGLLLLCLSGLVQASSARFNTVTTLEPDIWATVWLLDQVLGEQGTVTVDSAPKKRRGFVSFGYPAAELYDTRKSNFSLVAEYLDVADPGLLAVGELVSDIENLGWQSAANDQVTDLEQAFRSLQSQYQRFWVPVACYSSFFDELHRQLRAGEKVNAARLLNASTVQCQENSLQSNITQAAIPEISPNKLFERMRDGARVLFVDTREPEEFAETRIPGAVNYPLRELREASVSDFADADIVVPYCIKDFRGYEAARLLESIGVEHVSLMQPFGLAGWKSLGLPAEGVNALTSSEAAIALAQCVADGCPRMTSTTQGKLNQ